MIPKIIHYCWFGGSPLPKFAVKCIESWKKYLPDYEIKEWNESNFDVDAISYTHDAYLAKKYAFVSDYARFYILYKYGGLYFDTDVEIIKNMDHIIANGAFMGCENISVPGMQPSAIGVAPGLGLGVEPNHELYKIILGEYQKLKFELPNSQNTKQIKTVVDITTEILCKYGLKNTSSIQQVYGISIYPQEYFCPKVRHEYNEYKCTEKTVSIHHYAATWKSKKELRKRKLLSFLGTNTVDFLLKIKHSLHL